MLKNFSGGTALNTSMVWGGGHTPETDPSQKGWRCRPSKKGSQVLIIGQRGVPGCASVMACSTGWDVAYYDEAPEAVVEAVNENTAYRLDPAYTLVQNYPGWGLTIIERIERERKKVAEFLQQEERG